MEDSVIPDWFDATCTLRFDAEEIVKDLQEVQEIKNPTVDDVLIEIDVRLRNLFGRSGKQFVIFDSNGEEW